MELLTTGPCLCNGDSADSGRPQLVSVCERICVVPSTHISIGDRSFFVAGPRVLNALPSHIHCTVVHELHTFQECIERMYI